MELIFPKYYARVTCGHERCRIDRAQNTIILIFSVTHNIIMYNISHKVKKKKSSLLSIIKITIVFSINNHKLYKYEK